MDAASWVFIASEAALAFIFIWLQTKGGHARERPGATRALPALPHSRRRLRELRRQRCLDELPVLIDILSLGLSAGLSFDASLELFCTRAENDLAEALTGALFSWRCGMQSRADALASLAQELDLPAFQRFSSAVTESLAFGSPLAQVLVAQGKLIRDEQRLAAEERIEKVPIKMLIPLGTLVVPAMLLAILGPLLGASATLV